MMAHGASPPSGLPPSAAALEQGGSGVGLEPQGALDLQCRVYELETENSRLRLLVSELLVANQRLRERAPADRIQAA